MTIYHNSFFDNTVLNSEFQYFVLSCKDAWFDNIWHWAACGDAWFNNTWSGVTSNIADLTDAFNNAGLIVGFAVADSKHGFGSSCIGGFVVTGTRFGNGSNSTFSPPIK